MKKQLLAKIEKVESLLAIYSRTDEIRTKQLEKELKELNMQYLDLMCPVKE